MMAKRGRPAKQMTRRRQRVLAEIIDAAFEGERITLAVLARRCELYDYRDARRVVNDLRKISAA